MKHTRLKASISLNVFAAVSILIASLYSCGNTRTTETEYTETEVMDSVAYAEPASTDFADAAGITDTLPKVLRQEDLNIMASFLQNDESEMYENGKPLEKHLRIELIDKALFMSRKASAVDFLVQDTTVIRKKHGKISLKCTNKTTVFKDNPVDNEMHTSYEYIGQIPALNKYVVVGSYWEESDYKLIDKTTGKETQSFVSYPYLSADKQSIISIYANPYENTADLYFYTVGGKEAKLKFGASFRNWMPDEKDIFWSTDGYLYVPVTHSNAFWLPDGNLNDNFQYIRIGLTRN